MNRREFLHPHRLANIAGPALAIADELQTPLPASSDPVNLHFVRSAMATTFEVIVPFATPAAHQIAQAALDEIDRLESQLTVYRASSEVSQLNTRAAYHPVRVERNLFDLLTLTAKLHRDTEEAFDISVGALIKTWGFFRRAGRVPSLQERAHVRARTGMEHITLDAQRQTVYYRRQGLEINLGSIGKGYALDCAAKLANTPNLLIHGGHSSVFAKGNETLTETGWTIGLADPEQSQRRRGLVHLRNRGMATSAITHQHFEHEGRKLGHLLDPRTGWPAEGMASVTVTAPTAAEADALATAFFILGVKKAREYCERHGDIGAALITSGAPQRVILLGHAREEVDVIR